jgi:hypothetical protein
MKFLSSILLLITPLALALPTTISTTAVEAEMLRPVRLDMLYQLASLRGT